MVPQVLADRRKPGNDTSVKVEGTGDKFLLYIAAVG